MKQLAIIMGEMVYEDLLVADFLAQEKTVAVALESEVHEAVLAARVELAVLKLVGLSRAGEVEGAPIGGLDVEAEAVVVGALRLAAVEVGDLPDIVTLGSNRAGSFGSTSLKGSGSSEAGSGEESGDGGELHFEGWFGIRGC